ncbi:carboxypeptidase regulatory-like domain-containing protein [Prolixibacter bellariivorans]|uniref:carboxypeptidase regulatory-like domain-containing protein n=1 Tax=Prolixibacter bellariivorans TaxID=314319 RepID=UPI000472CDD0|nr:carboxypeptidase regulatory-like domain-containing protein [Prolixibacter bellariivorans]
MKKICAFLFLSFLLFPAYQLFAQSIEGRITDSETGAPLQQATVSIRGTSMGRIAGKEGQYKFENLKPGTYQLNVSFIGYEPTEKEVTVKAGKTTQADFHLISKIYQQEQILVTGNQVATTRELVPLTTSVVNEAEIENSSQTNILPLLSAKVPGMFVTQRGYSGFGVASGSAGQITIRGVGLNGATSEVLVMIDGQPQMMGLMGHPFPDSYVSSDLEKVEVIRGPGSLLYGTNAMGGVVNLITRKEDKEGFSGQIRGQYGSFNTVKAAGSAAIAKTVLICLLRTITILPMVPAKIRILRTTQPI